MKYPIGIQDFESLRTEGFVYVDKTALIYRLVAEGKYYFLARPRRFGKSLLLSTLKAYFEGKKELFEGLEIARHELTWRQRPVLLLALSRINPSDVRSLENSLDQQFAVWEKLYGVDNVKTDFGVRFADIILHAHSATGEKVVVLR